MDFNTTQQMVRCVLLAIKCFANVFTLMQKISYILANHGFCNIWHNNLKDKEQQMPWTLHFASYRYNKKKTSHFEKLTLIFTEYAQGHISCGPCWKRTGHPLVSNESPYLLSYCRPTFSLSAKYQFYLHDTAGKISPKWWKRSFQLVWYLCHFGPRCLKNCR